MTREHLLEAMGLLDDDLIREAEEPVRRKKWNRNAWISLAACLALVLTIGYGVVYEGWWSANSSSGSASAGASEDWAGNTGGGAPASSGTVTAPEEAGSGNASAGLNGEALAVMVPVGDKVYSYQHRCEQDRVLDTLPEGCRSLGQVEAYGQGEDVPYTEGDVFLGSELWIAGEGWEGPVYLKTPEGTYLECHLA